MRGETEPTPFKDRTKLLYNQVEYHTLKSEQEPQKAKVELDESEQVQIT